MLTITRALARHLRAVFQKTAFRRGHISPVQFHAAAGQLRILTRSPAAVAQYELPLPAGSDLPETFTIPLEVLARVEGRGDAPVRLQPTSNQAVEVSWQDGPVPRTVSVESAAASGPERFPAVPPIMTPCGADLWPALADARQAAGQEGSSARFGLEFLQLRGGAGQICATDTCQALIQQGFEFPWGDDLLIAALPLFGCSELTPAEPLALGRTENDLVLTRGGWTFWLRIEKERRFPDVTRVIPDAASITGRVRLDPDDAAFLQRTLARLPANAETDAPITLAGAGGRCCIRGQALDDTVPTELRLARSEIADAAPPVVINRKYLERLVRLGLREIQFTAAESVVQSADARRTYLFMALGNASAIAAHPSAVCIDSMAADSTAADTSLAPPSPTNISRQPHPRRSIPMPRNRIAHTPPAPDTSSPAAAPAVAVQPVQPGRHDPQAPVPWNGHAPHGSHAAALNAASHATALHATAPIAPAANPPVNGSPRNEPVPHDPLAEAGALKIALRDALQQTERLIAALRRQRKQTQVVQSTLASLRQLQQVG